MSYLGRFGVASSLLVFLAARMGSEGASLRMIVDDLRNVKSPGEIEDYVSAITSRLDRLLLPVLSHNRSVSAIRGEIDSILQDEGGLQPRDIALVELASRKWVGVAYNIPVIPSGSAQRVAIRIWGNQDGTWQLSPLTDPNGLFAPITDFPIKQMQALERRRHPYLLGVGEKGHGKGAQAFSLWDLEEARCIWTRKLEYGDTAVVHFPADEVKLEIAHEEMTGEHEMTRYEITEIYGWQNERPTLLSRTSRDVSRYDLVQPPPRH